MKSTCFLLCLLLSLTAGLSKLSAQESYLEDAGDKLSMNFYKEFKGRTHTIAMAEGTRIFHFSENLLLTYLLTYSREISQEQVINMSEDFRFADLVGILRHEGDYVMYLKKGNSVRALLFNFENKSFENKNFGRLWKGQLYMGRIADAKGVYILTMVRKTKDFVLHNFDQYQEHSTTDLVVDQMTKYLNGEPTEKNYFDPKRERKKGSQRLGDFSSIPGIQNDRPTPVSSITQSAKMYLDGDQLRIVVEAGTRRASSIVYDRNTNEQELFFIDYPDISGFRSSLENKSNSYYQDGVLYYMIGNKENVGFGDLDLSSYSQSFQTRLGQEEEVTDYHLADLELPEEEQKEGNGKELKLKRTLRRIFSSTQTGIKVIESGDQRYITLGGYTLSNGGPMMMPGVGGVGGVAGPNLFIGFNTTFERALSLDLVIDKPSGKQQLKEFEEAFEGMSRFLEDQKTK